MEYLLLARHSARGNRVDPPGHLQQFAPVRVSIVTPSFRGAQWLPLCIASVADQEGVAVEHIVQDSCSDDGTQEILAREPRVRAFIEKDRGMYDAVNRGLTRATGDVLIDQLVQMQRTGFDVAVLREGVDASAAQRQFERFAGFYQGSAVETQPHFAKAA